MRNVISIGQIVRNIFCDVFVVRINVVSLTNITVEYNLVCWVLATITNYEIALYYPIYTALVFQLTKIQYVSATLYTACSSLTGDHSAYHFGQCSKTSYWNYCNHSMLYRNAVDITYNAMLKEPAYSCMVFKNESN